jgi:hypothetical protein
VSVKPLAAKLAVAALVDLFRFGPLQVSPTDTWDKVAWTPDRGTPERPRLGRGVRVLAIRTVPLVRPPDKGNLSAFASVRTRLKAVRYLALRQSFDARLYASPCGSAIETDTS